MDLSKTISFGSYSVTGITQQGGGQPSYGVQFEAVNPTQVEVTGYFDKSALRDGVDAGDVYLGRRVLTIRASVLGSSVGDGWDRLDAFLAAFSPRLSYNADTANLGFQAFDFFQPTADISTWPTSTYPSGIPMRYYCRPAADPTWVVRRDASGGLTGRGIAFDVTASLTLRDPRKYLQTQQNVSISTSTQTATYRGNYPTWPIVTFSMSATGSSAMTVGVGGQEVVIDLSAETSGSYTLTFATRSMVNSVGASKTHHIQTDLSVFSEMSADAPLYYAANTTGVSNLRLLYREAWA